MPNWRLVAAKLVLWLPRGGETLTGLVTARALAQTSECRRGRHVQAN